MSALECVINVSEGRRVGVVAALADAAGDVLLDVHTDVDHHRSVLTLAGPAELVQAGARAVAAGAVDAIDLTAHAGVHPRLGAIDVVPFVPLGSLPFASAVDARDRFALWAAGELLLPCFFYGPERTLPEVRKRAFRDLRPDVGPGGPHPTAGGCAVGARDVLVAYNVWLAPSCDLSVARAVATEVRSPFVRALGLAVGSSVQVAMNLVTPLPVGPAEAYDAVASRAASPSYSPWRSSRRRRRSGFRAAWP